MMSKFKGFHMVVLFLCALGALNWGLVGLMNFNLVEHLSNMVHMEMLAKVVYLLIGAAGVLALVDLFLTKDVKSRV